MVESGVPLLRLVQSDAASSANRRSPVIQESLFHDASSLVLIEMDDEKGAALHGLLRRIRPRAILDLRPLPRFDFGGWDRNRVFTLFDQLTIEYVDVAVRSNLTASCVDEFLDVVRKYLAKLSQGPIMLLVDAKAPNRTDSFQVFEKIAECADGWSVISQ